MKQLFLPSLCQFAGIKFRGSWIQCRKKHLQGSLLTPFQCAQFPLSPWISVISIAHWNCLKGWFQFLAFLVPFLTQHELPPVACVLQLKAECRLTTKIMLFWFFAYNLVMLSWRCHLSFCISHTINLFKAGSFSLLSVPNVNHSYWEIIELILIIFQKLWNINICVI